MQRFSKLSICYVTQEYPPDTGWGGIGTYVKEIAHGLARCEHKVVVVTRALVSERVDDEDGVLVYRILPRLSLNRLHVLWRLNRMWDGHRLGVAMAIHMVRERHGCDIVEVPSIHAEALLWQETHGSPAVVVRIHSCVPNEFAATGVEGVGRSGWETWCERRAVKLAQGVSAPSHTAVRDNVSHLGVQAASVVVFPNPIDSRLFTPGGTSAKSPAIVLFVGRLTEAKGAHVFAKALPLVWDRHPETRALFVGADGAANGGGSMRQWILDSLRPTQRSRVQFLGHVQRRDLPSLYQQSSFVVVPSLYEVFGYVCLEAMACSLPVVASRSGGPEEIIEDGKTGFLVPPGDEVALALRINHLLADEALRYSLGKAARSEVERRFDRSVAVEGALAFYQAVLKRPSR